MYIIKWGVLCYLRQSQPLQYYSIQGGKWRTRRKGKRQRTKDLNPPLIPSCPGGEAGQEYNRIRSAEYGLTPFPKGGEGEISDDLSSLSLSLYPVLTGGIRASHEGVAASTMRLGLTSEQKRKEG